MIRVLTGMAVLAVGAVLLLSNLGVLPPLTFGDIAAMYGPELLIYVGLAGIWLNRRYGWAGGSNLFNWLILGLGIGFQLDRLQVLDFSDWIWPMLLILGGLTMLFGKRKKKGSSFKIHVGQEHEEFLGEVGRVAKGVKSVGSLRIGGADWTLTSGRYEHKLGDVKVDLRETMIPLGETELEIHCKVGDLDVRLPEGLHVWIEAAVKMGDVKVFHERNSGANIKLSHKSDGYEEAERKIRLKLFVKMGDIDVKRVE